MRVRLAVKLGMVMVMVIGMGAIAYCEDVFDGDWRGQLDLLDRGTEVPIRVLVSDEEAINYQCRDNQWFSFGPESKSFVVRRNNALLWWINEGGAWTETQIFQSLICER